jgi:hypothetical protein
MAGEWRSIPAHSGLPKINLLLTSDPGGEWPFGLEHFGAMGIPWYPCFPLEKWGSQGLKKKSFSTT